MGRVTVGKSYSQTTGNWSVTGSHIYYNSGNVGIGNSNPLFPLDVIGDVRISNNLFVGGGIIITEKVNATNEVKTKAMVADSIKLDTSAAFYGKADFKDDVKLRSKLDVYGDAMVSGNFNATNIYSNILTANTINTINFNVSNTLSSNQIRTNRIRPAIGDSVIYIGDSSLIFGAGNRIYPDIVAGTWNGMGLGGANTFGIGLNSVAIGANAKAMGNYSLAFGDNVKSSSDHSVAIGSGIIGGSFFGNSISNSLMIGFNSTIPTVFVSPAPGPGQTGKVGIGTTNPGDLLQVGNGYTCMVSGPLNIASALNYGTSYIGFNASRQAGSWNINNDGAHNGGSVIYSNIFGDIYFSTIPTNGTATQTKTDAEVLANTRLFIGNNGDVGIGTVNTAGNKLSVNGKIRAKEIVVETGWSDFVFEPGYRLSSLEEVEMFIKTHKHLPDVPSAEEISKNGLKVAETQTIMMQKIEELTLYVIEQNKKLNDLQSKLINLEKSK